MKSYYQRGHAHTYNRQWRAFTERTLAAVLPQIEHAVLSRPQDHPLRILDVGCGTGLLLKQLAKRFPAVELYGIDASAPMLEQAQRALSETPHIHDYTAPVSLCLWIKPIHTRGKPSSSSGRKPFRDME